MFLRLNRKLFEEAGGDPAPGGSNPPADPPPSDPPPSDPPADPPPSDPPPADPPTPFHQSLPDDWRNQLAGEDEKRLKQLERHTDLMSVIKSGFEAQDRIRKGEMSNGLPENPTDEQMAAWREANGVPESAESYDIKLDDGLVLGDSDNRILEGVQSVAHEENISNEALSRITSAMLKGREAEAQAVAQQDGIDTQTCDRQLKEMWGGDLETNKNIVANHLSQLPESVREDFMNGRLASGKAWFNSPEIMAFFADSARTIDPYATVVGGGHNKAQHVQTEIQMMREGTHPTYPKVGSDEYWASKEAQKHYDEQLELQAEADRRNK
ncbi:MAG: hypothetical protein JAY90_20205 [Candidatus Thiodiazotropha lotti]|nr:hypothetical protein [Candidatus Thiodiazotropha lotti]